MSTADGSRVRLSVGPLTRLVANGALSLVGGVKAPWTVRPNDARNSERMPNEGEDAFDGLCFHPPGEQSNVCFDVPMEFELMATVRAQVKALGFKRNHGCRSSA